MLDLFNAHVQNHRPWRVVGFDQRGEIAAEDLLDPAEVRLTVAGHKFRALFVHVQPAVCKSNRSKG